jgi:glucose/arabinose dehydrogenase
MPARALAPITLALLVGFFACLLFAKPGVTLPGGFIEDHVTDVPMPTALAFTPDDRMLVTSKSGQLYVYENENGQRTRALNIGPWVCDNSERGLLGVAVDPNFDDNRYVYLYYTFKKFGDCPDVQPASGRRYPVNRVSRFVMSGNSVSRASETVLIDNIPSPKGNHNAGDVHIGKDGYLYVSVGDGACDYAEPGECQYNNDASRDRNILLGKVLRIERDGEIPNSNPFIGAGSDRCNLTGRTEPGKNCQETFAMGFRNPFRMAFDPDAAGTRFRINDVGGNRDTGGWEEIDNARAGADYGWNLCEGRHDNPLRPGDVACSKAPLTPPIYEYKHSRTDCESITGGAFVPNDGSWPNFYDDSYLYGDFVCNKIFELRRAAGGGFVAQEFATVADGGPVSMTFGPHGTGEALYFTTFANGGEVRRIAYTGGS